MSRKTPFALRGWGIRVMNNPDEFEEAVRRAVAEAPSYGVTALDLHDGAIPPGIGWVDMFARYRQAQALRGRSALTYHGHEITEQQRAEHQRRFLQLCREIKAAGLRVHVWYHVLRDLPEEWLKADPTLPRLAGRRLWQVLGGMLEDFFTAAPEVDVLVVTANQAVAASMRDPSSITPGERLRAIYQCIYEACRRHRRGLIIREVGYTLAEHETFLYAVGPLPPDISIMAKDVQGDWCHCNAPLNPILQRLAGKNVILETDLYGEHWGQLEVPACRVEQIHHGVRSWLQENVVGAVGRIMVREGQNGPLVHLFDSPNAANAATLSRLLNDPGPQLEEVGRWDASLEAFDSSLWHDWTEKNYGVSANPYLVAALQRTPHICRLLFYAGGAYFQNHSYLPDPTTFEREMWPTFVRQVKKLGVVTLRWEKEEALRLVRQSLRDLELAGRELNDDRYENLLRYFEQTRDVVLAYRALLELCYARLNPELMLTAARDAEDLAGRIEKLRGPGFFGYLPQHLRQLSRYLHDVTRNIPTGAPAAEYVPGDDASEGAVDVSDLGVPMG